MQIQNNKLNSTLSFSGKEFQSFLNEEFKTIMFGKTKDRIKKSLLSPYFKAINHRDSSSALKAKSSILFQNRAF